MKSYRLFALILFPILANSQYNAKADSINFFYEKSTDFYERGNFEDAYVFMKKGYEMAKFHKIDSLRLKITPTLGYLEPDLNKALEYLKEVELIALQNKKWKSLALIYHNVGSKYQHANKDANALIYFIKTDSLLTLKAYDYYLWPMAKVALIDILNQSRGVNDTSVFPQIDKLIDEGLYISNKFNYEVPETILLEKRGVIYYERKQAVTALKFFELALKKAKSIKNYLRESSIYYNIATLYDTNQQIDSAEVYYLKHLNSINKTSDTTEIAIANYRIGKFYNSLSEPNKALEYLKKSQILMSNAFVVRDEDNYNIHQILGGIYYKLGEFEKAFLESNKANHLLEVIRTKTNIANVSELETRYQTGKKEQEIALLKSEKALTAQKEKNQRDLLLGGLGITSIAGLFLFLLYRNRQKTNTKLKELDALKSNFFANISHEFRTPLTLISSPIDDLLTDTSISDKKRQQFIVAKQNSERLLSLVNQLLDLSKIDAGHLKLHLQKGNVLQLISALSESFIHSATQQNINLNLNIKQREENVWFDKDAIEKIIVNLLSNALKYTPKNGSVVCQANIEHQKLILQIKNTGAGLTYEESNHIFDRFYQTSEQNQGTGIGLSLVKELIELHKGTIEVTSTPNQWTTFNVTIPVDKTSFKNVAILSADEADSNIEPPVISSTIFEDENEFADSELPILLIVEDNNDLRHVLKQTFETNYNVITAPNGELGLELALETIPDLIISDIMMPKKDGITLTNDLKNDERSAHIPIILLTAKADVESKFSGINTGADDYITKPFDKKLLVLKVQKLIESRRKLQSRYSQEIILKPKDIAFTNVDEIFLNKVQIVLDNQLVKSSFSVEDFSKAVGMSRMQLHRKIKALTGLSASEFIKSQRLKLAAQLIKQSDINIAQVGYSVGFNDHSYFSKCFKETYNCTPTEYAKNSF